MPAVRQITITTTPAYLSASAAARLAKAGKIIFRFSRPERKVYRKRQPVPVSEWCERHRVVTMSSLPGKWKNEVTPYLSGVMDASFFPSVREITLCKSPQSGGSEAVNNCIAYAADRAPGPCLYVYPDELTARENCQDRITPMFTLSPRLRSLQSGRDDDAGALKLKLLSMPIYMAWSSSVSRLANKPCRYAVWDETDKSAQSNKKETDVGHLIPARLTTYRWTSKFWKISSPSVEKGYIWQAMLASQVIFEYVVKCPACQAEQVMHFGDQETAGGVKWPADQREADAIEIKDLAWYQCEHCRAKWHDFQRDQAVRAGFWRAKNDGRRLFDYLAQERPRKIAFHVPAWLSTFVGISKIAAAYLRCKLPSGAIDLNAYKNFCNTFKAEPWLHVQQERKEDAILALCDHRPPSLVPGGGVVAGIFAGVDTQGPVNDVSFYFVIRAYGWSFTRDAAGNIAAVAPEKWLVRRGFVKSWAALEHVLIVDKYFDAQGNQYPVLKVVQDAMGHHTKEVYDFSRKYPGWLHPFQGMQKQTRPYKFSTIDTYPGGNQAIPGGVKLLQGNVTMYKNKLATDLGVAPGDPGCRWLHASVDTLLAAGHVSPSLGVDWDYAAQMTAEYVGDDGFWVCQENRANHYWDCEVYVDIAADLYGVATMMPPVREEAAADEQYQRAKSKYVNG